MIITSPAEVKIDCHRWYCYITITTQEGEVEEYKINTEPGDGIYLVSREDWDDDDGWGEW